MKTAKGIEILESKKTTELENNFMKFVDKKGLDECWNWLGYCNKKGYGRYRDKDKKVLAHRFAYAFYNGPITDDVLICHKCDNPSCCNPKHLELGTDSNNQIDCSKKNRNGGRAKLTIENVVIIKKMLNIGFSVKLIASMFEVSISIIYDIKNNRRWTHVQI